MTKKNKKLEQFYKSIYSYMKQKAHSYEGKISKEMSLYRRDQKKFSGRTFKLSNLDELFESIDRSQIVYLGDFHSFDQSSRNFERILRALTASKRKLTFAVELINKENQKTVNQYLKGLLSELEFLEEVNYKESWRFPWFHYKIIFDLAKENNYTVLPLNSEGTLKERDMTAAELISDYHDKNPDHLMLVLFGELHISPNKLPSFVLKKSQRKIEQTIIHQNLDEVFWKLGQYKNLQQNQIVKFNDFEFSLQTSPPWIKYESMIYWYENLCDDPEFDIHGYIMETGLRTFTSSVQENFIYVCQKLLHSLSLDSSFNELEDFNLYDHQHIELVLERIEDLPKRSMQSFYKTLVSRGRNFKLPFTNLYYCSSYSINRLSYLAGLHIQSIFLARKNPNYEEVLNKSCQREKFLFFLYQCIIGYLCSKTFNPYRKCDRYQDFKAQLNKPNLPSQKKNNLKLILAIIEKGRSEKSLNNHLKGRTLKTMFSCARSLGYYIGDVIHEEIYHENSKKFSEVMEILLDDKFEVGLYKKLMTMTLPKEKYKRHKKRYF